LGRTTPPLLRLGLGQGARKKAIPSAVRDDQFWHCWYWLEFVGVMLKEKLVVKLATSPVSSFHSGTGYLYHTRPVLLLIDSERRFVVSSIPLLLTNSVSGWHTMSRLQGSSALELLKL